MIPATAEYKPTDCLNGQAVSWETILSAHKCLFLANIALYKSSTLRFTIRLEREGGKKKEPKSYSFIYQMTFHVQSKSGITQTVHPGSSLIVNCKPNTN